MGDPLELADLAERGPDLGSLRILASAIAGRSVELAPASSGVRTWTDGRTIYLETGVEGRDRLELLGVQASLLAGGSLRPEVVAELRGHRSLADRYLAVEGHRALAANEGALPPWMRAMVDPGLAGRVNAPDQSLELARRERHRRPPWAFGAIDARRIVTDVEPAEGSSCPDAPDLDAADLDAADLEAFDAAEGDDDGTDVGHLLSSPVGGGGAVGRLLARLLRPTRGHDDGGDPGADAPTHRSTGHLTAGRTVLSVGTRDASLDGIEPEGPRMWTYPEWDERRGTYRPDWCRVLEEVATEDPGTSIPLPDVAALRRALARLGTDLLPSRRQRQGDDLDIDAVVEARVDRLVGGLHLDEVYVDSLRRRRDLSVLVLLDISGSAAEPGTGGRTVHEYQREVAAALTTALHRLGDRVALHAFSSRGRTAVQVTRIKGFEDGLDERVARRLGGLRPGAFTRLGAAIRHGAALLDAGGGTPRRLLVVLSDGFAYDHGYEGRYGEADARRALLEARRQGIGCLCLTVGADADLAALRRVFGATAHAALPSIDSLPASVGPLFAAASRSADGQRRSFQRTERTRGRLGLDREGR